MRGWRAGLAFLIVAALAVVLVVSLVGNDPEVEAADPTTTTVASTTTTAVITTTQPITTTTSADQRLAEVKAILEDLWFRWFDAIYRRDESQLWEFIATTRNYDAAVEAMVKPPYPRAPTAEAVDVSNVEILLDRADCLVVYQNLDVSGFRGEGAVTDTVTVLWSDPRHGWRLATGWASPNDLWQEDCDLMVREETP